MAKSGPEARVIKRARDHAHKVYGDRLVTTKYHGDQFGEAGVSDLLCCIDGVFVAAEAKAPNSYGFNVERAVEKGPTLKQRAYFARVEAAGGVAGAFADTEGFMALLDRAVMQNMYGRIW